MRRNLLRVMLVTAMLSLLAGTEEDRTPFEEPCPPVEPSIEEGPLDLDDVAVPRALYRRGFRSSDLAAAPWFELADVEVRPQPTTDGESDLGLELRGRPGGHIRITPEGGFPIGQADHALLTLHSDATAAAPIQLEFELFDPIAEARLIRPIELVSAEQTVEIPLAQMRYERGRVPLASRASAWGFRFVRGGTVALRQFELWQHRVDATPELGTAELRAAFPVPERVLISERGPFVLLTDESRLNTTAVLDTLDAMYWRTRALLPQMPEPTSLVPVLIFSSDRDYREFWPRFAKPLGVDAKPRAQDEGYTWLGVATAVYSSRYGPVRPTYVHEAHHALLERAYGLAAQGSWIFEGLANVEQLEVSQQDLASVYRRGLRRVGGLASLSEIADGRPIVKDHYWQVTLLAQWLRSAPQYARALDSALVEMSRRGSTDLRPLGRRHFGLESETLAVLFTSWAWSRYGA